MPCYYGQNSLCEPLPWFPELHHASLILCHAPRKRSHQKTSSRRAQSLLHGEVTQKTDQIGKPIRGQSPLQEATRATARFFLFVLRGPCWRSTTSGCSRSLLRWYPPEPFQSSRLSAGKKTKKTRGLERKVFAIPPSSLLVGSVSLFGGVGWEKLACFGPPKAGRSLHTDPCGSIRRPALAHAAAKGRPPTFGSQSSRMGVLVWPVFGPTNEKEKNDFGVRTLGVTGSTKDGGLVGLTCKGGTPYFQTL